MAKAAAGAAAAAAMDVVIPDLFKDLSNDAARSATAMDASAPGGVLIGAPTTTRPPRRRRIRRDCRRCRPVNGEQLDPVLVTVVVESYSSV